MTLTLRLATEADIDTARTAHHAGYRDTITKQFGAWDEALQDQLFAVGWNATTNHVLLWNGVPCGYCATESKPESEHVHKLVIHPNYQRQSIGSLFLDRIIAAATKRGVPVTLNVLIENNALHFYQKYGFVEYGRTRTHRQLIRN